MGCHLEDTCRLVSLSRKGLNPCPFVHAGDAHGGRCPFSENEGRPPTRVKRAVLRIRPSVGRGSGWASQRSPSTGVGALLGTQAPGCRDPAHAGSAWRPLGRWKAGRPERQPWGAWACVPVGSGCEDLTPGRGNRVLGGRGHRASHPPRAASGVGGAPREAGGAGPGGRSLGGMNCSPCPEWVRMSQ